MHSFLASLFAAACLAIPAQARGDTGLAALLKEAAERNPDVIAARREADAAASRVEPSAALDDPMLEAGLINVPTGSWSLSREDMTMKMIGISQRLPYPGKRALRREAATREADAVAINAREALNRVQRDVKVAYFELWLADESIRISEANLGVLRQLLSLAEARYGVGQGTQADVFKAQTQLSRMEEERLKLGRERPALEAELARAIGRPEAAITPQAPGLPLPALRLESLKAAARGSRPQLAAQQRMVDRGTAQVDLARKDYYPDFDVRLQYGQRDNYLGMKRDDMVSITVAINLPVWGETKRDPKVSEAEAGRSQAQVMLQARLNEVDAMLRQQVSAAEQGLRSLRLYDGSLVPQARLASDASLSAYRVGRVDFFTLLDSRMTAFNAEVGRAAALVAYNKALAEIEFLTGTALEGGKQ